METHELADKKLRGQILNHLENSGRRVFQVRRRFYVRTLTVPAPSALGTVFKHCPEPEGRESVDCGVQLFLLKHMRDCSFHKQVRS